MKLSIPLILLCTFVTSYFLVGRVRRVALRRRILDIPNERSSHSNPTPRGGGIAIVVAFFLAMGALAAAKLIAAKICVVLVLSGLLVAGVGFVDDRRSLNSGLRFVVHVAAAALVVSILGAIPAAQLMKWGMHAYWIGLGFSVLVVVWATNLFNFMDGIDGIAGAESFFMSAAGAWLNWLNGGDLGTTAALLSLSVATLGFLPSNWPPASIFMGDVGSGFLGFMVSCLMMLSSIQGALPVEVLGILGGIFLVDATVTLVRRMFRGDRWYAPHRTHAYQVFARKWGHKRVTLVVIAVDVFWLLPWAYAVVKSPGNARLFFLVALSPLVIIAIAGGAGKTEETVNRK